MGLSWHGPGGRSQDEKSKTPDPPTWLVETNRRPRGQFVPHVNLLSFAILSAVFGEK